MFNPTKPWILNRTWFLIPVNLPLTVFLLWAYSDYTKGKTPLIMLILAILMVISFNIYFYTKLKGLEAQYEYV